MCFPMRTLHHVFATTSNVQSRSLRLMYQNSPPGPRICIPQSILGPGFSWPDYARLIGAISTYRMDSVKSVVSPWVSLNDV